MSTPKKNQEPTEEQKLKEEKERKETLGNILGKTMFPLADTEEYAKGLNNLNQLPEWSKDIPPVKGKEFDDGVMGFRRLGNNLSLAIACGKAQVRYISLNKYIALVENLDDKTSASIILQNFTDQDGSKQARGQIIARINPESSAIQIIQGLTGRVIRGPGDIALFDVYYIDRAVLTSFYLAAKAQISSADTLETMISAHDGWKAFEVPLNPLDPYGDE